MWSPSWDHLFSWLLLEAIHFSVCLTAPPAQVSEPQEHQQPQRNTIPTLICILPGYTLAFTLTYTLARSLIPQASTHPLARGHDKLQPMFLVPWLPW